jgi:hypothetical protein
LPRHAADRESRPAPACAHMLAGPPAQSDARDQRIWSGGRPRPGRASRDRWHPGRCWCCCYHLCRQHESDGGTHANGSECDCACSSLAQSWPQNGFAPRQPSVCGEPHAGLCPRRCPPPQFRDCHARKRDSAWEENRCRACAPPVRERGSHRRGQGSLTQQRDRGRVCPPRIAWSYWDSRSPRLRA